MPTRRGASTSGLATRSPRQSLLYLQTGTSAVDSPVIGMLIVQDGRVSDGVADPADWPYKTVVDALGDGWRAIRFPIPLPTGSSHNSHVVCEFILEKWE